MVIPVAVMPAGGAALSAVAQAVAALYGAAADFNGFLDRHIASMKASGNHTVSRTGHVLEMAKLGFGLGYLSSVTILAVGQFILGNPLGAVQTVATAATLTNPVAMTCAAVGAIVYGWAALSDAERNSILERLAQGLEIGVELIKAIIGFVVSTAKSVLDSSALADLKQYIAEKAALFGRSLSDVTHLTVDVLSDAAGAVKRHAQVAVAETSRAAGQVLESTSEVAKKAVESGKELLKRPHKPGA